MKKRSVKKQAVSLRTKAPPSVVTVPAHMSAVAPPAAREAAARANAAYSAVVASAQLASIRLVQMNFGLRPEYGELGPAGHDFSLNGGLAIEDTNREVGAAFGIFNWTVEAKTKDTRESHLRFDCSYVVEYAGLDLNTDEADAAARVFVRRVGRFAVYPYVRALLSRLAAEAGADVPIMPVLKEGTSGTQARRERARPVTEAAPSDTSASKPSR